jgi:non-ribosomal peptide synthase protein (TIGR01720 family)
MTIPIGRPIANTQLYILDPKSQPVPIGVPGELHIGGDGLAHGYLNDSVLTAEKFIANPHAGSPGTRLYRTGDIARYRSDGAIEFIGRADRQVKIRGFRIELGEIEVHLRAHPQVIEAVVLAREDTPGDKRLAAYVVPRQQQPAESDFGQTYPTLLRAHLHERLPEYMVPASYVLMDSLPLTPNGKLDHRALPRPEAADRDIGNEFVAPRNAVEMKLAEIWQQVLDLERVGIHDNFFALGGDSILSIQIVARARQAGLEVTPKQFFQHQTIADLARVISFQTRVRAEQGPITGAAPLTPVQQWFFEQELQDPHHFNQAVLLLVPDLLDAAILRRAFEAVVTHHDALRVRFRQQAGAWEQFFATPDGKVQFSAHDLAGVPEAERSAAIERIAAAEEAGLDLMHGPVALTAFFDCGPGNSGRLLIVIHHLAVDAVSWRLLMEDFWTAYDQMSRGDAVRLPAKTTSFRDWSVHLSMRARTADIRKELPHWLTTVNDEAVRSLPRDFNGSTNLVESAQKVSVSLSEAQTAALLRQVPEAYKTQINDALLTALVEAFSLWTGERALLVDVEGHGREAISEEIDLSRTVGWFTSIYPVCLRLPREISIGGALKSIKEQLRRLPGRGMGYGLLRYLSLDPSIGQSLSALRQPEVSFNYLGQILAAGPASSIRLAEESCGPTRSLRQSRRYLLEINGRVFGGRLQLEWTFSEAIHRRATIETLARNFLSALISIIEHCQSPEAGGHTPSDFSQAKLSQAALDKLVARVKHSAESEE